jgi:replicative DNA helicase
MNINEILLSVLDRIDELHSKKGSYLGLRTGFDDIDGKTLGLKPRELIVIAGSPSMGKTMLATNILRYVGINSEMNVAYFSFKCTSEEIVMRMLTSMTKIALWKLRTGQFSNKGMKKIALLVDSFKNKNINIIDSPTMSIKGVCQKCRDIDQTEELDLVIVDDIQQLAIRSDMKINNAMSEITYMLKYLAISLNIPIIIVSQLNNKLEKRKNKRPRLSDLANSKTLVNLADIIMSIYRDEVYNENTHDKGIAEIRINKNRFGSSTSFIKLSIKPEHMTFETINENYELM